MILNEMRVNLMRCALGLSWQSLGTGKANSVDVQAAVDVNSIHIEEELEEYTSPIFDQF